MTTPQISIIVAVYNTDRYLRQSISSVLQQTFTDWELIIIDDGSTDGSAVICDETAQMDSRIRVVHKENSGQAASRNLALGMARGKYVAFLDSDDWLEPQMLERQMQLMESASADAVVVSYQEEYTDSSEMVHNLVTGTFEREELSEIYFFCKNRTAYLVWGMLIRRELLTTPIPHLRYCEDTAIILQWIGNVQRAVIVNEPLYHYRMRKGSVMHVAKNKERTIANLKAFQLRYQYARQQQLLQETAIDTFTAEAYLYTTLQFVRNCSLAKQRKEVCLFASELLQELSDVRGNTFKRRTLKRLLLLKNSPVSFAWRLYVSGLFSLHEHQKKIGGNNLFY